MKPKVYIVGILCLFCVIELRCIDYKQSSFGSWNEIVVVADGQNWKQAEETLRDVFEKVIITPQKEKVFKLYNITPHSHRQFRRQKNIIIFSSLLSEGPVGELVRDMLSPKVRKGVEDGEYYVFIRRDEWAKNQMIMLLVANTIESLQEKLSNNKDHLFSLFYNWINEKAEQSMFERGEQVQLEKELYDEFGWSIRVQQGYSIAEKNADINLVWMRQVKPDRFIIVHWIPSEDGRELRKEWIIKKRNWIGAAYIDSMEVEDQFLIVKRTEFLNRYALHVQGLWKIERWVLGGPFQTWAFFHEEQKRIYLIDISVFAPGEDKLPHLQKLHIMANSFSTDPPKQ